MTDRIALILSIIGALNWGLIGIFKFDGVDLRRPDCGDKPRDIHAGRACGYMVYLAALPQAFRDKRKLVVAGNG